MVGATGVGDHGLDARLPEGLQDGLPALGGEVVREEAPVADDDTERDGAARRRRIGKWDGKGCGNGNH